MLSLKFIISHFDRVEANFARRGTPIPPDFYTLPSEALLQSKLIQAGSARRATLNGLSKTVSLKDPNSYETRTKIRILGAEAREFERLQLESETRVDNILKAIPNLLDDDIPPGVKTNEVLKVQGDFPNGGSENDHQIQGFDMGILDTISSHASGPDAATLKGTGAGLYRALANYFLDHYLNLGYSEYHIPSTVTTGTLERSGFSDPTGSYLVTTTDTKNLHLLPSIFVGLSGIFQWATMQEGTLPRRCVAAAQCGTPPVKGMGRSTHGFTTQNQFSAVGSLSFVDPEDSDRELQHLVTSIDSAMCKLDLHYRLVLCCAGKTDPCARKTFAFEVWVPSLGTYCEVTRCSNYGDYISRRMSLMTHETLEIPHMVGDTGIALNRLLVAILEQKTNPIKVPEVLRRYLKVTKEIPMGGNTGT